MRWFCHGWRWNFRDNPAPAVRERGKKSHRNLRAGAASDQGVMLDAAVFFEIEHGGAEVVAEGEVERRGAQLVLLGPRLRGALAGRRDDRRAADHTDPVFGTAF